MALNLIPLEDEAPKAKTKVATPDLQLKSLTAGGATFTPKGAEKKELQDKINEAVALKSLRAPFEIMSSDDRGLINEMRNIPNILVRVKELAKNVPQDRQTAFLYKKQIDTPIINELTISKDQRALKTNLELLIQTVVKSFQGARPSDRDQEIMNKALGAIGEGQGNFLQALNELAGLAKRRAEIYAKVASKGWGIKKEVIDDLIDLPSLVKLETQTPTPIGTKTFKIGKKTYNVPSHEVPAFKKEMGL